MIKWTDETGIELCRSAKLRELYELIRAKALYPIQINARSANFNTRDNAFGKIVFYDSRIEPEFVVAAIEHDGDSYIIFSDEIKNDRYAHYNRDRNTKRTGDLKKAFKIAMEYVRPAKWSVVAGKTKSEVHHSLREWTDGPASEIRHSVHYSINRNEIYDEIVRAMQNGYKFESKSFLAAVDTIEKNKEEAERRERMNLTSLYLFINPRGMYESDLWNSPVAEGDLPEEILTKVALLKMLNGEDVMDEVGQRIGNQFWVYVEFSALRALTERLNSNKV